MSQASRLQTQLERSPWPTPHAPIIFLLDTSRGYEQRLLTQWITTNEAPSRSAIILCLNLRNDRKTLIVDALADALATHPDAYVAPLRISWLSPQRETRSGPQLADLIRGGERRHLTGWRAMSPIDTLNVSISHQENQDLRRILATDFTVNRGC